MTFNEVHQVRLKADRDAIAELLAQYPWGRDVEPRAPGSIPSHCAGIDSLSADPAKRKAKLQRQVQIHQNSLFRSIEKHDSLKRRGLDNVGDADLMVCYSGDALKACKFTIELHEAHISYDLSILEKLDGELAKLDDSIPPGFVLINAVLPAYQAYQIRKWGKSAQTRVEQARAKARMNTRMNQREPND